MMHETLNPWQNFPRRIELSLYCRVFRQILVDWHLYPSGVHEYLGRLLCRPAHQLALELPCESRIWRVSLQKDLRGFGEDPLRIDE